MGFQNANKNEFHSFGSLVIWLWKIFGNISKGSLYEPCLEKTVIVAMYNRVSPIMLDGLGPLQCCM